jgi:hypothetical protein
MTAIGITLTAGEYVIAFATLLGPILAIQAQQWIERGRERKVRKEKVFFSLMATRQERLSSEHVQALNMIDLAFYGQKIFTVRWQTKKDKAVIIKWREYFDSLSIDSSKFTEDQNNRLIEDRYNKFISLLHAIAIAQNYEFEILDLRKNTYSPQAHGAIENEHAAIRSGMAKIFNGKDTLRMEITNLPNQSADK